MPKFPRMIQFPRSAAINPTRQAVESAALYTAMCSLYIVISGYLATRVAGTPEGLHAIETFKGIVFVLVTGVIFFVISFLRLKRIQQQEEIILRHEKTLVETERKMVAAMSTAVVAHDLNNLLMVLSGLVNELKGQEREDPFLFALRKELDIGINKLSHLTKRLASTVSRTIPEKAEPVDMEAALNDLIAIVQNHPDVRGCRISSSGIAPLTLVLCKILFEQAVVNLLLNAAQATGPGGHIEVDLTIEQDFALLAIHDNGPGVPDDLFNEIFEPCFTTKSNGTGLGLLAVNAFVASCGAEVSVGRSPLGGALFQFRIPIKPSGKTANFGLAAG
jgi:signal transduction histidine kinase